MSDYDKFIDYVGMVFNFEGGYVNHPADPGGATNLGITQNVYSRWLSDNGMQNKAVRGITRDEAQKIYYERYWLPNITSDMPDLIKLNHFDACVNHGRGHAVKFLQGSNNDWRMYLVLRYRFYANLTHFNTFGRGWVRRATTLFEYGIKHEQVETQAPLPKLSIKAYNSDGNDVIIRVQRDTGIVHIRKGD